MTRTLLGVTTLLALVACGGGGGSGARGARPAAPPPAVGNGSITVTVVDAIGDLMPGIRVRLANEYTAYEATAGADGRATFLKVSAGTFNVNASEFEAGYFVYAGHAYADVAAHQHVEVRVVAQPAGNTLFGSSRSIVEPGDVSADGRSLTFRLMLEEVAGYVEDGYRVSLSPCAPDPTNDSTTFFADCVVGSAGFDRAYDVVEPSPAAYFEEAGTSEPYSAALLVDQSGRIIDNDPWNRRLFGIKYFVSLLASETVSLAAFAADAGGQAAKLPHVPVTLVSDLLDATAYPAIDNLATLEGGATPFADALDRTIDRIAALPLPIGQRRRVVVLTDGHDDTCGTADQCRLARQTIVDKSTAMGVEVVLLVLPGGSAADRHNLADLVTASDGRAFWLQSPNQIPLVFGNLGTTLKSAGKTAEVTFRIESQTDGTFVSGRTVRAVISLETCPWDCSVWSLPVAVRIP